MESKRPVPSDGFHSQLPLDVWQRIFALLGTKDWAKVSGTCRAFRGIQLGVLDLDVHSHDALRWAGKHWQASSGVILAFKSEFDFSYLPPEVSVLGNLERLKVSAGDTDKAFPMWVGSLLMCCTHLQALMLDCNRALPFLPPLTYLRHLMLRLPAFSGSVLMGIGILHGLQSISLQASNQRFADPRRRTGRNTAFPECPQIDFSSLLQLKNVRIERIKPNELILPEDCALHLVIPRPSLLGDAKGNDLRIESLKFRDKDDEVSSWLTPLLAHCTSLQWTLKRLGTASLPYGILSKDTFGCLRELCLESSTSIHLFIPAPVKLTALHVSAQEVEIRCEDEDADAAVADLAEFSVAFVSLLGLGVLQLQAALERQGKVVVLTDDVHYGYEREDDLYRCKLVGMYLEGGQECSCGLWDCSCNACERCVWARQ